MDTSKIQEHMEVVGSDGVHVGTVDHLDGANQVKLTKTDTAAAGEHHWIYTSDIERIDGKVFLKVPADQAKKLERTTANI